MNDPAIDSKIQVTYFQRKPRAAGNHSLEFIFSNLRTDLENEIDARVRIAPFLSNGLFRRLSIMLDAWTHRGQINHITGDINFAGLLLPSRRTVLTILDCGNVDNHGKITGAIYRTFWFTWPARRAAIITTISEASRRDILRVTGCDPNKITVIPVAVSDVFKYSPKLNRNPSPRLLHVGTSPNKNLERIIEAVQGMDCELVVIGELTQQQRQRLESTTLRYENHVGLSTEQLFHQYALCDVVVFASLFEGFGMPIVEGQTVGRPVVTSNVTSMPEVAGNGACYVDPEDVESIRNGINRVIHDQAYRKQLVADGLENAKRFDSKEIARQYLSVYQTLIPDDSQT